MGLLVGAIDHVGDLMSTSSSLTPRFTEKQGQYLAFIHTYNMMYFTSWDPMADTVLWTETRRCFLLCRMRHPWNPFVCEIRLRKPLQGTVESLISAAATGICLKGRVLLAAWQVIALIMLCLLSSVLWYDTESGVIARTFALSLALVCQGLPPAVAFIGYRPSLKAGDRAVLTARLRTLLLSTDPDHPVPERENL